MYGAVNPIWFITGCSTGFGHELAKLVLARGWRAVVTARDAGRVAELVGGGDGRGLALPLDVTDQDQIAHAARTAHERFGRIDVLVNNAGYGYQASVEEGVEAEIRAQFDANVFGLFALTRAVGCPRRSARSLGRWIMAAMTAGTGRPEVPVAGPALTGGRT